MKTYSHIASLSHTELVELVERLMRENEQYRHAIAKPRKYRGPRIILDAAPLLETAKNEMLDGYAYCARCGQAWSLTAGEPPHSCEFCANRREKELRFTGKAEWLRKDKKPEEVIRQVTLI